MSPVDLVFKASLLGLLLAQGCAPAPMPSVLRELDAVRESPRAREARTFAPQAFAHAQQIHERAEAFAEKGDLASAQIEGERAIAAYAHATAWARIGAATEVQAKHEGAALTAGKELLVLESDQSRLNEEIRVLETELKVLRDVQPIVPSDKADPAREKARRQAAKNLLAEARLLCVATRLLSKASEPKKIDQNTDEKLTLAEATLSEADSLIQSERDTPVDFSARARAECLAALTSLRRAVSQVSRAPVLGDKLLSELSKDGLAPSRDERGVLVTLRGDYSAAKLPDEAAAKLQKLAAVAKAHPNVPIVVVTHDYRGGVRPRSDALTAPFRDAQVIVSALSAGDSSPLALGSATNRNQRVEVIFITPETL